MQYSPHKLSEALRGVLIGTAVGDSLGLPAEGLSRKTIQKRWGGGWRQRLIFGRGMISDDTEHACFVAQSLLRNDFDASVFQKVLAGKLRWWLLGVPAGIGLATLKSILRLWVGFSPERSGVNSAGNGPAMRSALIGAYFADDPVKRRQFVTASTQITHTDARALVAAMAVAEVAAAVVRCQDGQCIRVEVLACLRTLSLDAEWQGVIHAMDQSLVGDDTTEKFAERIGLVKGVSGYAYHSVPVAIYAWLRFPNDFQQALCGALNCGGDTDTVGAILGAMVGAETGESGIPQEWVVGIWEWPRDVRFLRIMADRLALQKDQKQNLGKVGYFWPLILLRNGMFILIVLGHGLRRLVWWC